MAAGRGRKLRHLGAGLLSLLFWPLRTLRRMTPDGLLFAFLALVCAVVAARSVQLANVPLLVGMVLFSVLCTSLIVGGASLRSLKVTRHCAERTFAGEPVTVTLTINNPGRMPLTGLSLAENLRLIMGVPASARTGAEGGPPHSNPDSQRMPAAVPGLPRPLATTGGEAFAMAIAGRGRERVRYSLMVRRRGIYAFGRTRLTTVFPFGFWRSFAERRVSGRFVVYPRLGDIDTTLFQEMEVALQRLRRSRSSREELDFRSLREYRLGDNPKWIHWRSSARLAKPLVKEFEEPQSKRVLVLVDTNLQRLGAQRFPAFELALSFAATAVRELVRRGCEVTCCAQGPEAPPTWATVSRERRNLDACLELLAGLRPDNSRTLANLRPALSWAKLRQVYVLALGLGSLRVRADLTWLECQDNAVKILDVRGEEFRRLFRRATSGTPTREESDEELLLALGDEELDELAQEELALVE